VRARKPWLEKPAPVTPRHAVPLKLRIERLHDGSGVVILAFPDTFLVEAELAHGRRLTSGELQKATGLDQDALWRAMGELWLAGVLEGDEELRYRLTEEAGR